MQKLHELGAKWSYDGWTHFHLTISGTDTQWVINTLESIFGDPPTDSKDEDLDIPSLKCKRTEATSAEAADASFKQEYDPSKETKFIKVVDNFTPVDYGIQPDLVPKIDVSPKGKKALRSFINAKCVHIRDRVGCP